MWSMLIGLAVKNQKPDSLVKLKMPNPLDYGQRRRLLRGTSMVLVEEVVLARKVLAGGYSRRNQTLPKDSQGHRNSQRYINWERHC
jgi:hypothetical protein